MDGNSTFEERRDALVERLATLVRDDVRLVALWLQGSLADGTADPLSDIDAYLAVRDDHFAALSDDKGALAALLGEVLVTAESPHLNAIHCLMAGPVKLDLFLEQESLVDKRDRPAARIVVDKAGIASRLRTGLRPSSEDAPRSVDTLLRVIHQGAAWPLRLIGRGQWTTLAYVELLLINDNLTPLMLAQIDPAHLFRNPVSRPRLLTPPQREEIEALGRDVLASHAARDLAAMRDVHLRISAAIFREGRAACSALGIDYPLTSRAEAAITAFYREQWPVTLDAADLT